MQFPPVPANFLAVRMAHEGGRHDSGPRGLAPTPRALLTVRDLQRPSRPDMFPFKMTGRARDLIAKEYAPDDLRPFRYGVVPDTARYKSSVTVRGVRANVMRAARRSPAARIERKRIKSRAPRLDLPPAPGDRSTTAGNASPRCSPIFQAIP